MSASALTATTVRYLFATTWLPRDEREDLVAVPGGGTTALDTAGNLLHNALWDLRRQGLIELEQLRPVEKERVVVLGGRSFARFEILDRTTELRGLEGALLRAGRGLGTPGGWLESAIQRATDEDERGVRRLVLSLDLRPLSPWDTVTAHCFAEASAAGLVRAKGRLFRRVEFTDMAAVESLRERHTELRAARATDMEREPELHDAVISDCLHAVSWAYNTDP